MTARIQTKIDQLLELNVDVDAGLGWLNRTGGDLDTDDKFLYNIERGAARYTNEIILNPTRESGLRSLALSKSPFTTMLFQLTTYPAAFTNTVLKDMVKRTARGLKQGDIGASGKVIGTALTMQAAAMTLNYVRNVQFNKDEEYKYKTDAELLREGLARWGGNGLHFDMVRVGLSLYGYFPVNGFESDLRLYPALKVKARVTLVREVEKGTGVGYGHCFKTQRKSKLANSL